MSFQVSPGVNVTEIDLTTIVPAVSTSTGAIAGLFHWGPVGERIMIDSEKVLQARFGNPSNLNAETWFTAASFLGYGNSLYVARAIPSDVFSAFGNTGAATANLTNTIYNEVDYINRGTGLDVDIMYLAKYPGSFGNSLRVSVCDSANAYSSVIDLTANTLATGNVTFTVGSNSATILISNTAANNLANALPVAQSIHDSLALTDLIMVGSSASIGTQYLKITSIDPTITSNSTHHYFNIGFSDKYALSQNVSQATLPRNWEFYNLVNGAPGTSTYQQQFGNTSAVDEVHVVVVDQGGKFTGVPGSILETYKGLSRATDSKTVDGSTNYYKNVINQQSQYIWWSHDRAGAVSNAAISLTSSSNTAIMNLQFVGGTDGTSVESNVSVGTITTGYDLFASAEDVDISLLLTGKAIGGTYGEQLPNYLIDNIALKRLDCVVFVSPGKSTVVNNVGYEASSMVNFRNASRDTSYGVLDSGYKYMYDRYNDIYRWIPLNGDMAGLCARTDNSLDPWWSPAGFNRGQIKNIVKLAYNPRKADRDTLYKAGINPVVSFPGQGTILYGDKTMQSKPSAFDRINVRRLFIVLEKSISTASKYTLFEFNDAFTRSQFKNLVTPFLRTVKGRRGIYDFLVVCDETNNTPQIIDSNQFIGDIYIKPARAINFIQLNFVAVGTGVQFTEVVGKF
jgi:phage tail sheath protein FI